MTQPGTSESFDLQLAKVQAYTLGQKDELNLRPRRTKDLFIKKNKEHGEEVWKSYCEGYDNRFRTRNTIKAKYGRR